MPAKKNALGDRSLAAHKRNRGKIAMRGKVALSSTKDFATYYTPGIAAVSALLAKYPARSRDYTWKGNAVAVISDGSSVLGLGNIGPDGALPVMEGKALIFRELAGIDAVPIVLSTQNPDEIVAAVTAIAPSFSGINLEDIAAPACFSIEERLTKALKIPVMHDDQHGTAIVVLAGLINAAKVTGRSLASSTVVISGAGAAGIAIARLLKSYAKGMRIYITDSRAVVSKARTDLTDEKAALLAQKVVAGDKDGSLEEALVGADIFIGVSRGNLVTSAMVASMAEQPIVFALANPEPEIMPALALRAGAAVVATGRSDFPNQINNALVFPGVFRGALDAGVTRITPAMKLRAALALAALVRKPTATEIIPSLLDPRVVKTVAKAVASR